jgi:hypothetical protein
VKKDLTCAWISKITVVKTTMLLKVIYIFNAIQIKILMILFTGTEKATLNLYGSTKDPK